MSATLSEDELVAVTGGYLRPKDQLRELYRQGFYRARKGKISGRVVLERAHYDAVCGGRDVIPLREPRVRQATLKALT